MDYSLILGQEFVFGFLHKRTVIGITVGIENKDFVKGSALVNLSQQNGFFNFFEVIPDVFIKLWVLISAFHGPI